MNIERLLEFAGNHPILFGALFFSIAIIFIAQKRKTAGNAISASEVVRLINDKDAQIIDLRADKDYATGHIINSQRVSTGMLGEDISRLKLKRNKPVVLICQTGVTAASSVKDFTEEGFEEVYNMAEGIYSWTKAKLPLEA